MELCLGNLSDIVTVTAQSWKHFNEKRDSLSTIICGFGSEQRSWNYKIIKSQKWLEGTGVHQCWLNCMWVLAFWRSVYVLISSTLQKLSGREA